MTDLVSEPSAVRWTRRAKTIPAMLAATAVAIVGLPLFAPMAVVADLVRGRLRLPTLRVYLFVLQYAMNDSVEILAAPIYWAMAGFGARTSSRSSMARYERLQWWSASLLEKRARQLLGLHIEFDEASRSMLAPGPVIVISRHVSLFDASLPGLVYHQEGFGVRGVIMAELLADPGFDLMYVNTGSVFIPRDRGADALAAIRNMATTVDAADRDTTAMVIFPEGRLFKPSVRDRALAALAESEPERATRLAGLTQLLPPRPGGVLALLDTMPDADVVLLDHRGLERVGTISRLLKSAPIDRSVTVSARRIPATEIPTDRQARVEWLDELWLELDRELTVVRSD